MGYRTMETVQKYETLKCLKSLVIRKIQITTTLRFHLAIMKMAKMWVKGAIIAVGSANV